MLGLFKRKKELDSKSKHIAVMYLSNAKHKLEKELSTNERFGENEIFTAKHDIKCIENAINYLEN
jgi:hypothetical protein